MLYILTGVFSHGCMYLSKLIQHYTSGYILLYENCNSTFDFKNKKDKKEAKVVVEKVGEEEREEEGEAASLRL